MFVYYIKFKMKNPTIIDKFIKKLDNNEEIDYDDEEFNKFINSYDINKHIKMTNLRVCYLLQLKLNNALTILFNRYIRGFANQDYNEFYNPTPEELIEDAENYITERYNFALNHVKQFKLIKDIKLKYNAPIQTKIISEETKKEFIDNCIVINI